MTEVLVAASHVSKSFDVDGDARQVLDDVSIELRAGEIVALLGRSGSGKSTLLRIIAGLIAPSEGAVQARGETLDGVNPATAMVFQSFALMPWLTVQDNVELGLVARGVPPAERRTRALRAIDVIGLDGFETAYPRELSGGMRQRVGFARALVLEPEVLLMDEPFSALDVLTAENLRREVTTLLGVHGDRAVCLVTHNIEEAVLLADRIIVLDADPGRIRAEIAVDTARPRDSRSPAFRAVVDHVYGLLTGTESKVAEAPTVTPLPDASVEGIAGLLEIIAAKDGRGDLPDIASELNFEIDDLLPLVDGAALLGFLTVDDADVELTEAGWDFCAGDIQVRKRIFAARARRRAPLVRTICRALGANHNGDLHSEFFVDLLRRRYGPEDAQRQLDRAIAWGRYGELFDYDTDSDSITVAEQLS